MNFLTQILKNNDDYKKIEKALKPKSSVCVTGLTEVHKSILIKSLCHSKGARAFCVANDEQKAQTIVNDLCSMGLRAYFYPSKDFIFREISGKSGDYEHQRLNVLYKMLRGEYDVVVSCLDAAAQYTIPPQSLENSVINFKKGTEISTAQCAKALTLLGYRRYDQVDGKGQFSIRGGILDFFMPDSEYPVRAQFWGDEITDLNYFDIETQRSIEDTDDITLTPSTEIIIEDKDELADKINKKAMLLKNDNQQKAKEILLSEAQRIRDGLSITSIDKFIGLIYKKPATLFDYLDKDEIIFVSEYKNVKERARAFDFQYKETLSDYFKDGTLCRGFETYYLDFNSSIELIKNHPSVFADTFAGGSYDFPLAELVSINAKQLGLWNGSIKYIQDDLDDYIHNEFTTVILAGTPKGAENLADNLRKQNYPAQLITDADKLSAKGLYVMPGALSSGFEFPTEKFVLISQGLYNNYKPKRKIRKKNNNGQEIYSLSELSRGDYVVHSTHGIGIFGGIQKMNLQGVTKDYIRIEYAKGDVLYVPVTQLDLVAKYIGPKEDTRVKINRLGSTEWQKTKSRVKASVKDIAKELIALYAERMKAEGYAFTSDSEWQRDFELKFEYEETEDQLKCSDEIKHDMCRIQPMDRLLCGDVGFGKTEVALRAAFRCVSDSKQCALLCPTTILAWQHYQTALKRFEGYPVKIELLSRFRTPKQQKEIINRLARGDIDFIIGTHRLVQNDVIFRDLGLAIIDEEQRFGVKQKERFKELRKNIDILTLSATPIPRTLNMAMSGIRDMSVIEEAPRDRHPVQTYVLEYDNAVINEAIRKELRRGGQVFYLYNKTDTIEAKAAAIRESVPEASIAVAHGKMDEKQLSDIWRDMLEQKVNVLVCTTIIETGVDLPNANTLIIENADRMGLSQLHQIRGRVGRSSRKAYAYFTFPPYKTLSDISTKRLNAIREFTEFGSGFKIAMRDLELRGAGNILGAQQHGHMENVGYDMYLKLLSEAVSEEKGEENTGADIECLIDVNIEAHIPEKYIYNTSQRLEIYRRIADIRNREDCEDVRDELKDRFGEIPKAVEGLIEIAFIRNIANSLGIYEIKQNETSVLLYVKNIRSEVVPNLMGKLKGQALLNAGNKPYISVRYPKNMDILEVLGHIFN
ncbi:MAG: transcription-repair coupling factor [Ruminococcus sp.]|nr:transcription-repair coupling factor [Ruminococcus sp.]